MCENIRYTDENTAEFDGCVFKRVRTGPNKNYFRCRRKYAKHNGETLHRAVFKLHEQHGIPANMEIHHVDGNKLNNEIGNLAAMTCSAHIKLHNQQEPERITKACARAARKHRALGYTNAKAAVEASRRKGWPGAMASAKSNSIPVLAYTVNGEPLGRFSSIKKAATALGVSTTSVANCLRGTYDSVKGVSFVREVSAK